MMQIRSDPEAKPPEKSGIELFPGWRDPLRYAPCQSLDTASTTGDNLEMRREIIPSSKVKKYKVTSREKKVLRILAAVAVVLLVVGVVVGLSAGLTNRHKKGQSVGKGTNNDGVIATDSPTTSGEFSSPAPSTNHVRPTSKTTAPTMTTIPPQTDLPSSGPPPTQPPSTMLNSTSVPAPTPQDRWPPVTSPAPSNTARTDFPTSISTSPPTVLRPITNFPTNYPSIPPPTAPRPPPPTAPNPLPESFKSSIVLEPGSYLEQGDTVFSPNGLFSVGLTTTGYLELRRTSGEAVWRSPSELGAARCYLQSDGQLILRTSNGTGTWRSDTYGNSGAHFEIDDGGQLAVMYHGTALWLNGIPRGSYNGPSSPDLGVPLRGMFYYPWFPETWTVNGSPVKYQATLGRYHTGRGDVQLAHIEAFRYARVDLAICSWFGPGKHNDPARLTNLMAKSSDLKWTVYHEQEMRGDPSVEEIKADLDYLKKWYAWRDSWAHMDGRPVIFVWNEGDCDVVKRWMQTSNGEWFVVLKLFGGDDKCEYQPDLWHQYGPGSAALQYEGHSFSVSPGFWKADLSSPKLIRLNESEWRTNVQNMLDSGEPLQLVTTFNEWGEGTAVESANQWSSSTGQGMYMDVLHQIY